MKKIFLSFLSLIFTAGLYAQSADFITKILESEQVTYGQAGYFTAVCLNLVGENASQAEAVNALFENKVFSKSVEPSETISNKAVAGLFTHIWKIKGGLMFRLTKGCPWYAFKQLKQDGVFASYADPDAVPSGADFLNAYTNGNAKYAAGGNE